MKRLSAILALACLAARLPADEQAAAPAAPGLVRVVVTYQEVNQFLPWIPDRPKERSGYGIPIAPGRLLTTERLLRNHRLVELQKARSGEKIAARVDMADPQVNLALLRFDTNAAESAGLSAVELVERAPRDAELEILQFFDSGEVQRIKTPLRRISMERLPDSPFSSLTFTVQTETSIDGEGAPAMLGGRLAGLAMTYDRSARTAGVIPYPVIRRFLDDALTPPYTGFASAGFLRTELVDPVKRAYLGARREGGVFVLQPLASSHAAGILRPGDVVVEWDGTAIDNMGFYIDPDFGRLDFSYLIKGRHSPGDRVPVTLVRDRAEITVQMELDRRSDEAALIPEDAEGRNPEYLVEGGFVLRELTARYLQAHGADWVRNIDGRLAHLYLSRQYSPETPGERVVVISVVLTDPVNIGYQYLRNQIVRAVNGEAIHNLTDVFRIAERDRHISRLTLQGINVDIALDSAALPAANARLAAAYRIPRLRYQRPASKTSGDSALP